MGDTSCCSSKLQTDCAPRTPTYEGEVRLPRLNQSFVIGSVQTSIRPIPQIASVLLWPDRLGTFKARWGIGRMHYTVDPGLYALGDPDKQSPVLVTANYKMSFDALRAALPNRNVWILALDTKGINVWCAAGKGTFGTQELVNRIESSNLPEVVSHRELIVPQLGGPGLAAHEVKKLSGFKVIYGPIKATDLPSFLDKGLKATAAMRLKTFTTRERAVLIPVELIPALKAGLIAVAIFFLVSFLERGGQSLASALNHALFSGLAILTAIVAGAVLTPLLLPWLPGRAFSLKGFSVGFVLAVIFLVIQKSYRLEAIAWFFLIPSFAAYLAMNFTGASTYTSLSGVKREMRRALPLEIGAAVVGLGLWIVSHVVA
jgi:hypothetical protein